MEHKDTWNTENRVNDHSSYRINITTADVAIDKLRKKNFLQFFRQLEVYQLSVRKSTKYNGDISTLHNGLI